MNQERALCQGCGSPLQTERPGGPGYIPAHVLARNEPNVCCQRCFRIEQYGTQVVSGTDGSENALTGLEPNEWRHIVKSAGLAVLVVDIWDFEGSFLPELAEDVKAPLIVAVNKIDLLPARTPPAEVVAWVEERCRKAGLPFHEVRLISAERATGIRRLRQLFDALLPDGGQIVLLGATNVGKSALMRRLLPKGSSGPTISTLPGTTQGPIYHVLGPKLSLVDTPGVVPGHRISDLLCPQCASMLVPRKRLRSKLLELRPGRAVLFGGLAALRVESATDTEGVTLAFGSERAPIHHTRAERVVELLQGADRSWLHTNCNACRLRIEQGGWEEVRLRVEEGQDLVLPGLGWISPRRAALDVAVTLPAGAVARLRPRLVGTKTAATAIPPVHRPKGRRAKRRSRR